MSRTFGTGRLGEIGIPEAELNEALDPARMCAPNGSMVGGGSITS